MAALQTSDKCSHTHVCCALSIGLRLALEPDLRFETTSRQDQSGPVSVSSANKSSDTGRPLSDLVSENTKNDRIPQL